MKLNKFDLSLLLCSAFILGVVGTSTYMYQVSDSPLMIRDKAFNDTVNDLLELSKRHVALKAKYEKLLTKK